MIIRARSVWNLITAQMRMYLRDRQSVFFALFFPLLFLLGFGLIDRDRPDPVKIGIVDGASAGDGAFVAGLRAHELIDVSQESEPAAREALETGKHDLVLVLPDAPIDGTATAPIPLRVLINAAQPQRSQRALAILNGALTDLDHQIRHSPAMFSLDVKDVRARDIGYLDFLVPGLLAFMVLQLSISGSGFNIVEYKRKGILTRLFVTPLRPIEFIISLIASRLTIILVQVVLLLTLATVLFDVSVHGSIVLLLALVVGASVLFLSFGFALGGFAKTQSAIMAIGNLFTFPQIMLAGVFFPLELLPDWLRPVVSILPLRFVADALREVANEGADVTAIGGDLLGLAVWMALGVFLAVRLFHWNQRGPGGP